MHAGTDLHTDTRQVSSPGLEAFIARWGASAGAERANYQLFLAELCDALGVPRPDPSVADEAANAYVFDKAVTFPLPDGKTTTTYIDLYRKGAFVCETKQSVDRPEKDPLSVADPAAPKARRKTGTSVRGTAGWDDSMIAARGQAENYVRGLADDNPPFLLVIDIGHSFELYADFSRLGKVYTAFPDARSHRFSLAELRDEPLRERLGPCGSIRCRSIRPGIRPRSPARSRPGSPCSRGGWRRRPTSRSRWRGS